MPFIGDTVQLVHPREHKFDKRKRSQWILLDDLVYQAKVDRITVEAGFETDLASVPRLLVWLVPRFGRYTRSAILHDYLLKHRQETYSRHDADGIFRRSMREHDVPVLLRWMMWAAVGLNSAIKDRVNRKPRPGVMHELGLLAVAIPSLLFVLLPAVVVQAWLLLMWVLEWVAYPFERLAKGAEANKPEVLWKL